MISRMSSLMRKEFLQFFRDKMLVMLILYTFAEPVLCGVSLFIAVNNMPLAIIDGDRTVASRELVGTLARSEHFEVYDSVGSVAEARPLLQRGDVQIALVIPAGYEAALDGGKSSPVQLIVDGSTGNTAQQAIGYAQLHIAKLSRNIELARFGMTAADVVNLPVVESRLNVLYDPDLRFTNFVMLAMVAFAAPVLGILLGAVTIVREKEKGTLEQLMVTPINAAELITAKLLPMAVVKMGGLAIGIAIAVWGFGVPVRGSLLLYFAVSTLIFIVGMGIGVAIGTIANTMQQSLLLAFFVIFPMSFLSGMLSPVENMPLVLQWLSLLSPFRYYLTITMDIFLKGVGMSVIYPQVLSLAVLGVAILGLSLARFQKSLA